jgi:hypothetical protein
MSEVRDAGTVRGSVENDPPMQSDVKRAYLAARLEHPHDPKEWVDLSFQFAELPPENDGAADPTAPEGETELSELGLAKLRAESQRELGEIDAEVTRFRASGMPPRSIEDWRRDRMGELSKRLQEKVKDVPAAAARRRQAFLAKNFPKVETPTANDTYIDQAITNAVSSYLPADSLAEIADLARLSPRALHRARLALNRLTTAAPRHWTDADKSKAWDLLNSLPASSVDVGRERYKRAKETAERIRHAQIQELAHFIRTGQ